MRLFPMNSSRELRNGGSDHALLYLNVYDLTPVNNYLYWLGFGIFHSGIEVSSDLAKQKPHHVVLHQRFRESGARKIAGGDEGFSVVLEVWVVLGREEVRGRESGGGAVYARVGTTEMKKRRLGLWLVNK
ncbi:unnamed protein product [Lactuca virosa]|uniref:PPPDE domain-containing protein n=1 Tax=Lactuca virosa TaxID=75947 RepID=A0AAU9NLZ7_9ASTR|nr:unnamed protein product [Lactuca virosa]